MRLRQAFLTLGLAASAWVVLAVNTAAVRDHHLARIPSPRRFWDDTAIAIGRCLQWIAPGPPEVAVLDDLETAGEVYGFLARRATKQARIRSWQFWRSIPPRPFLKHRQPHFVPPFEDTGRALLLAAAFRAIGGVAPYLLFWLGALLALPIFAWIAWEFLDAGFGLMAALLFTLFATSAFLVEALSLPHSAVGFYLLAVCGLLAWAVYAVLGRSRSRRGFWLRLWVGGLGFALCALCRSGTLTLLPGFFLVLWLAVARVFAPIRAGRRILTVALAGAAFVSCYLVVKPAQHHDVWLAVWEGLGDFDCKYEFYWVDAAASAAVVKAGGPRFWNGRSVSPAAEAILRRLVIERVRSDPAWYVTILTKRLLATMSQAKLAPWAPRDGISLEPPAWQYRYTRTIDSYMLGKHAVEVPLTVLLAPGLVLAGLWLAANRAAPSSAFRQQITGVGLVVVCVALATLPLPVAISTAGGIETQAFGWVYWIAAAFIGAAAVQYVLRRLAAPSHPGAEPR